MRPEHCSRSLQIPTWVHLPSFVGEHIGEPLRQIANLVQAPNGRHQLWHQDYRFFVAFLMLLLFLSFEGFHLHRFELGDLRLNLVQFHQVTSYD